VVADRGGDDAGRVAMVADLVVAELAPLDLDVLPAAVSGSGGVPAPHCSTSTCSPRWSPSHWWPRWSPSSNHSTLATGVGTWPRATSWDGRGPKR